MTLTRRILRRVFPSAMSDEWRDGHRAGVAAADIARSRQASFADAFRRWGRGVHLAGRRRADELGPPPPGPAGGHAA